MSSGHTASPTTPPPITGVGGSAIPSRCPKVREKPLVIDLTGDSDDEDEQQKKESSAPQASQAPSMVFHEIEDPRPPDSVLNRFGLKKDTK